MTTADLRVRYGPSAGSSAYYSLLFLAPEPRLTLSALYAFAREVRQVRTSCGDPQVARAKLQWWRTEAQRIPAGSPQHPVTQALCQPALAGRWSPAPLLSVVDAALVDLEVAQFATDAALDEHCRRSAGALGELAARACGAREETTVTAVASLCAAVARVRLLRDAGRHARQGRIYLPHDALRRHRLAAPDLLGARAPAGLRSLLADQAERATAALNRALAALAPEARYQQRSQVILAELHLALLRELAADDYRVLEHHLALTPVRKLWIAWRQARRLRRGGSGRGR